MKLFSYMDNSLFIHHSYDEFPDNRNFYLHSHDQYELFYFISGAANFLVEGDHYQLKPGDILLFNIAETHRIRFEQSVPYERIAILFSKSILIKDCVRDQLANVAGNRIVLHRDQFPDEIYELLLKRLVTQAENQREHTEIWLLPLLMEVMEASQHQVSPDSHLSAQQRITKRVLEYINENIANPISADQLVRLFPLNRSQLFRIVKEETGMTFWNYVNLKRLTLARHLLLSGTRPTQVYQLCGFQDYSVFYRAYLRQYGYSPGKEAISKQTTNCKNTNDDMPQRV